MKRAIGLTVWLVAGICAGCVPRIEISTPTAPITINMNVKIEHEITIKADKQSQALLQPTGAAAKP